MPGNPSVRGSCSLIGMTNDDDRDQTWPYEDCLRRLPVSSARPSVSLPQTAQSLASLQSAIVSSPWNSDPVSPPDLRVGAPRDVSSFRECVRRAGGHTRVLPPLAVGHGCSLWQRMASADPAIRCQRAWPTCFSYGQGVRQSLPTAPLTHPGRERTSWAGWVLEATPLMRHVSCASHQRTITSTAGVNSPCWPSKARDSPL